MSLQFSTVGFINFNTEYNKVLPSGAITVSFTSSTKDKDGKYQTQYYNAIVPAKIKEQIKPLINKELCDIKGVINQAQSQKGLLNITILEVGKHEAVQSEEKQHDNIPF